LYRVGKEEDQNTLNISVRNTETPIPKIQVERKQRGGQGPRRILLKGAKVSAEPGKLGLHRGNGGSAETGTSSQQVNRSRTRGKEKNNCATQLSPTIEEMASTKAFTEPERLEYKRKKWNRKKSLVQGGDRRKKRKVSGRRTVSRGGKSENHVR